MTFTEEATKTVVTTDATGVAPGSYQVILESYNTAETVHSALMSDTVTVVVEAAPVVEEVIEEEVEAEEEAGEEAGEEEGPTCPVTQLDFDAFAIEHANYFELEAQ